MEITDGRRARRERGRLAASDAMIDLVFEGLLPPTPEQVAERAGISIATLFRYFETLDDMRRDTAHRYFDRYAHLGDIPNVGEGDQPARIAAFVQARVRLHGATAPMARLARSSAVRVPALDDIVKRIRATRSDQVRHHFDEELSAMTKAHADDVTAMITTLTAFEAWDHLTTDHERSAGQVRRAWTFAIAAILA